MCQKCGGSLAFINTQRFAEDQAKKSMYANLALGGVNLTFGIIGQILNGSNNDNDNDYTYTPRTKDKPKTDEVVEDDKKDYTDEEIKDDIKARLKDKFTNIDDTTLAELVERYKQIKSENPDYNDNLLTLRLENFVRGKVNQQKTTTWTNLELQYLSTEEGVLSDAKDRANLLSAATSENEIIDLEEDGDISMNKLRTLSMQVLEFADSNGDRAIDLVEYYRNNLISYYQTFEKLNIKDATQKADEKISDLNLKTNEDVINYAKTLKENTQVGEEVTLMDTMLKFASLNQSEETIGLTSSLDIQELMAYHATMANFNTSDSKIDNGDFSLFNNSMTEDIMMTLENGTSVNKREYFLENYYNAIKNFKEN